MQTRLISKRRHRQRRSGCNLSSAANVAWAANVEGAAGGGVRWEGIPTSLMTPVQDSINKGYESRSVEAGSISCLQQQNSLKSQFPNM